MEIGDVCGNKALHVWSAGQLATGIKSGGRTGVKVTTLNHSCCRLRVFAVIESGGLRHAG
jgi:hypothetical protein